MTSEHSTSQHGAETTVPDGISVIPGDDAALVLLRGAIDAARRPEASRCMLAVLACEGPVTIDTSGVTFIDSSGLAFLLQLQAVLIEAGRSAVLRDPSGAVVELLALVGLETLFVTERGAEP